MNWHQPARRAADGMQRSWKSEDESEMNHEITLPRTD
jgi:hypothetical protein